MVPAQSACPMDPPGQHEAGMCGHVCASECSQCYVCMSTSTHRVSVLGGERGAWAYAAFRKGRGGRILLIGDLNICFECYSILNTCDVRQSY